MFLVSVNKSFYGLFIEVYAEKSNNHDVEYAVVNLLMFLIAELLLLEYIICCSICLYIV